MSHARVLVLALGACGHYSFESAVTVDTDANEDAAPDALGLDASLVTGLQVWLECDSITNGSLVDSSGQGSVATCSVGGSECPMLIAGGPRGMACRFDGQNDVVTVAPDARFQSPTFTSAVWLRLDVQSTFYLAAWIKHSAGNSEEVWGVYHFDDGARRLVAGGSSNGYAYADLPAPALGEWVHVAVSYDGTTYRAYRNGSLAGGIVGAILDAPTELVLGAEFAAVNRASFWPGALDDARLYDHVLSDAEILALAAP